VRRKDQDWLLEDLARSVPETRHVMLLSRDGICKAKYDTPQDDAERLAAASSGLKSLAHSVAQYFPHGDRTMKMLVIQVGGGFFYLMDAGEGACLAVLADEGVDSGLIGQRMKDLVDRLGEHLTSPPREQVT
jgi:predicted regulator of Ras-like GTPase activity (Roadblock/LC7/MglB family)